MAHALFQPELRGTPIANVHVRAAAPTDAQGIAEVDAACMQLHPPTIVPLIATSLQQIVDGDDTRAVFVAEVGARIVGYGKCAWLSRPQQPDLPNGWYLNGLEVLPDFRRGGIGTRLTHRRLAWLDRRTATVWYYTGAGNRTSVAMHASFGFDCVTEGITAPAGASSTPKISHLLRRRT